MFILLISNHTVFLVQFGINLHLWVFQKAKLHSPKRLVQFQLFEKTHSCKLIPNWTRNRMITYTNKSKLLLELIKESAVTVTCCTIFAASACANERVHVHNERNFSQAKVDSEINGRFLSMVTYIFYCKKIVYILSPLIKKNKIHCRKEKKI